jgi:hypothetical protein
LFTTSQRERERKTYTPTHTHTHTHKRHTTSLQLPFASLSHAANTLGVRA